MARTLEQFPSPTSGRRRYPWDQWMDGQIWLLVPDEDFTAKPTTIRTMATQQAIRRGGRVRCRVVHEDGREKLAMQFQRLS